jgi:hypothetical protein
VLANLRDCVAANAPPPPPDIAAARGGGAAAGFSGQGLAPVRLRLAGGSSDSLASSGLRGSSADSLRALELGGAAGLGWGSGPCSSRAAGDSADSLPALNWPGVHGAAELPEAEFAFSDARLGGAEEEGRLGGSSGSSGKAGGKHGGWDQARVVRAMCTQLCSSGVSTCARHGTRDIHETYLMAPVLAPQASPGAQNGLHHSMHAPLHASLLPQTTED